jgi:hypothetical protein
MTHTAIISSDMTASVLRRPEIVYAMRRADRASAGVRLSRMHVLFVMAIHY